MAEIHQFARTLPIDERFRIRDQIERASLSVAANIAEGYRAFYYKDKIKIFYIARKEASEMQSHIEALFSKNYLPRNRANEWSNCYEKVIAGINNFVKYIRQKNYH